MHPAADGSLVLPVARGRDVAWAHAADAVRHIRQQLPPGQPPTSIGAVAALAAATAGGETGSGLRQTEGGGEGW